MFASRGYCRLGLSVVLVLLLCTSVQADKSAVDIRVPGHAVPGTAVTITVVVSHEGNSFFHYTDWVWLRAGGEEIARWAFSADNRPEDEIFSRQVTWTVHATTVFSAMANCNLHGSAGPAEAVVQVVDPASPTAGETVQPVQPDRPGRHSGRGALGRVILALGIVNLLLIGFQVASGRRWIKVRIAVHRRTGQLLFLLALVHGVLGVLANL